MTAYLSAQSALNIPNEGGGFTDWHLLEAFSGSPSEWQARCSWVGDGLGRKTLDTRPWLGDAGVWDATEVLARHGVQMRQGARVWAARPWRAVLDMVLTHAAKGRVAQHLSLADLFDAVDDADQLHTFFNAIDTPLRALPASMLDLLDQWVAQQVVAMAHA
jgi:hypothetical protein